jgi:hypothetical protein
VNTGFDLAPNFGMAWIVHNPNSKGQVVQLVDGVRIIGEPSPDSSGSAVGLWSLLTWDGDFVLTFSTRYVEGSAPITLYFGATDDKHPDNAVGDVTTIDILDIDYYDGKIRGGRINLYESDPKGPTWTFSDAPLHVIDSTIRAKVVGPSRNSGFQRLPGVTYQWRLSRTDDRLTLEQFIPGGNASSCTWTSDLTPQFTENGGFGFLVPVGVTVEITGLDLQEPSFADADARGPVSPWRFMTDPTINWTPLTIAGESIVSAHAEGVRVVTGDSPALLWAKTRLEGNDDWQFSWHLTWSGIPADNNGTSGQLDLLCYTPLDGVDPNTRTPTSPDDLSLEALATQGQGLVLQMVIQDAVIVDRSDRAELAVMFGDGTLDGVATDGSNDLGFLPDIEYEIQVRKRGDTLTIRRISANGIVRVASFTAVVIAQLANGWLGFHITPGREFAIDKFDMTVDSWRNRGGRLRTGRTASAGDPSRVDMFDIPSLDLLTEMRPGTQYVQTAPILDLDGATLPVGGRGDRRRPLVFRGASPLRDPATFPVLRNGTLEITARAFSLSGLTLENVRLLLRQGARTVQLDGNWFRGLRGGAAWAAVVAASGEEVVDVRISRNLVAPVEGGVANRGGFIDIEGGSAEGVGARRVQLIGNDIAGFEIDPDQTAELRVPVPVRLGRAGYDDQNRNADIMIRLNRFSGMALPEGAPTIDSQVGGVEITDDTFEIDEVRGALISAPQGRTSRETSLSFDIGLGTRIAGILFACTTPTPAPHGVVIGDGYATVINCWSAQVDADFPPTTDSPSGFGTISLLASDNDWRTYAQDGVRNAGRASIGGNRLVVQDGVGSGIPPDACVVASDDVTRPDHNQEVVTILSASDVVSDLEAGPVSPTDYLTPIFGADFDLVPIRLLSEDVGPRSQPDEPDDPVLAPPDGSIVPTPPDVVLFPTRIPFDDEPPTASTRQVYVLNDTQYQAALRNMRPGDEIILAEGLEVGFGSMVANLPFDQPAIVRAEIVGGSRINGANIAGSSVILHGLECLGRKVTIYGDRNAAFRCLFHGWADDKEAQLDIRGQDTTLGLCDFRDQSGTSIRLDGRRGARRAHVFQCLFRDCDVRRGDGSGAVLEITPPPVAGVSSYHLVERCLLFDINQKDGFADSTIVLDGSDNILRFLQLSRSGSIRADGGWRNMFVGLWLEPGSVKEGNLDLRGEQPRCYGVTVGENGAVRLLAGDTAQTGYEQGVGASPAVHAAWISDCRARLLIGVERPAAPTWLADGTVVIAMRRGWSYEQTRFAKNTSLFPDEPVPGDYREITINLSPAMVGSRSPWPVPRLPPPVVLPDGLVLVNDDSDVLVSDQDDDSLVVA